jgi:ferredoxin
MSIDAAIAAHPGFTVHPERCTQCGICQENCPAEAISLDPHPVFNTNCFLCHNCARLCPEEAITMDSQAAEERIRDLADFFAESPSNAIFT